METAVLVITCIINFIILSCASLKKKADKFVWCNLRLLLKPYWMRNHLSDINYVCNVMLCGPFTKCIYIVFLISMQKLNKKCGFVFCLSTPFPNIFELKLLFFLKQGTICYNTVYIKTPCQEMEIIRS